MFGFPIDIVIYTWTNQITYECVLFPYEIVFLPHIKILVHMWKKPVQMCNYSFHMQKKGQFLEWANCLFLWGCCCVSCFISCCSEGWYHEMQLNAAHSEGARANQRARFLPAASLGNRGPLFPKIRKTQSAAQPLPISDIWHMCSDCLVLQASFPCDCFLLNSEFVRLKLLGLFSRTENWIVVDPPPLLLPFPPGNKNGILTFLRISVHHGCFWRQLEAFLMETFTHPGKMPRPQDSAKPLMMIESASAPRWKHAESLTLQCAARLALGLEGGRRERGFQGVGVGGGGCLSKCLMGPAKAEAAPICWDGMYLRVSFR